MELNKTQQEVIEQFFNANTHTKEEAFFSNSIYKTGNNFISVTDITDALWAVLLQLNDYPKLWDDVDEKLTQLSRDHKKRLYSK